MVATRSATALAAAQRQRRQQLLFLLVGLLIVLSPHCVGAKLFKRRNEVPTQAIESSSESSAASATTAEPAEQVCDELMARSLVKASDEKAAVIAERDEALANVVAGEERIAELEQKLQSQVDEVNAATGAAKAATESEAAGIAAAHEEAAMSIQTIRDDAEARIVAANNLLEQTKEEHAAKLAEIEENTQRSLQDAHRRAQNASERAKAEAQRLEAEHAAKLAEIEENTQRSLQDAHRRAQNASERARNEAQRLEAAKIQEIGQIKNLAGSTVTEANKKAQKEKEELEKRFAEALEAHEEKMGADRRSSARAIAELKGEMETKLQNAQEEASAEVAKLEAELQKTKDKNANAMSQIAQYEAKIEELSKNERLLSSSSRNLQENILKFEDERASTYINITNIEREVIAVCNEIVSTASDFFGDLALSGRDWTINQSKRAYSNALDLYFNVIRPAVGTTATGVVDSAKATYASHIQPPMNQLRDNARAKYSEVVQPHIDEHLMPIYEGKVKPAFNQYVLPIYINHVTPAYDNRVVPAMNRALDATVASWDVATHRAVDMKQSAWKDIKEALKLAKEASMEAYGYAAAFIRTFRSRAFEASVDGAERFFDGCLSLVEKYDQKGVVPDMAKEKLVAVRDNAEAFVETAAWATLACLFVAFLPSLMRMVMLVIEVAAIIAFELVTWPFRVVWFFCPLRLLFGRKEEVVPDAVEVSPAASVEVGEILSKKQSISSDEPQSSSPDFVNETVSMYVRPITPTDKSMSGPQTRSRVTKKD